MRSWIATLARDQSTGTVTSLAGLLVLSSIAGTTSAASRTAGCSRFPQFLHAGRAPRLGWSPVSSATRPGPTPNQPALPTPPTRPAS
jgi:hypothetical protein